MTRYLLGDDNASAGGGRPSDHLAKETLIFVDPSRDRDFVDLFKAIPFLSWVTLGNSFAEVISTFMFAIQLVLRMF